MGEEEEGGEKWCLGEREEGGREEERVEVLAGWAQVKQGLEREER